MLTMAEDYSRITIRLKPYEQNAFRRLMSYVQKNAGYEVAATDVVKSLMGFEATRLKEPLGDKERMILKKKIERKLRPL